jgi:hypothetical protein
VALFGDSRPVKEQLKALGGKFNAKLSEPKGGGRAAGWVFSIKQREALLAQMREYAASGKVPALPPAAQPGAAAMPTSSAVLATFPKLSVYVVEYSAKAVAVFGETKSIKTLLGSLKGRFNASLADPTKGGASSAGWIFPKTSQAIVVAALSSAVTGAAPAVAAATAAASAAAAAAASGAGAPAAPAKKKAKAAVAVKREEECVAAATTAAPAAAAAAAAGEEDIW